MNKGMKILIFWYLIRGCSSSLGEGGLFISFGFTWLGGISKYAESQLISDKERRNQMKTYCAQ